MFYSVYITFDFQNLPFNDISFPPDASPPFVFVVSSSSVDAFYGQSAIDYLVNLGFSLVNSGDVNLPSDYPLPSQYLILDYSNFSPSLDVYSFNGDVVFVKDGSYLPYFFDYSFHIFDGELSIFGFSSSEVFFVKSPNVDYHSIISNVLATSFVEVSLNGSSGAKFRDGDIVEVQGFPSRYEVLASQYIVNNENTGTIMYKLKDVSTGMIHYVPQVYLRGILNDTNS